MKKIIYTSILLLTPAVAFSAPSNIFELLNVFKTLINILVPLLFAVAVLLFLFGIVKFMFLSPDDAKKREEGKMFMVWGIIALFVMVSFWGFVNLLTNTFFGINSDSARDRVQQNDGGSGG